MLFVAGILLAACGPKQGPANLVFDQAWVRPLPPGMKMTAGFGALHNTGDGAIVLVSFSSPSFGDVSLHRTEQVDGVSKMRAVPELTVAAGEEVLLEPGGFHLMLMMPRSEMKSGQHVTLEMASDDGRRFVFEVPIERR